MLLQVVVGVGAVLLIHILHIVLLTGHVHHHGCHRVLIVVHEVVVVVHTTPAAKVR